MNENKQMGNNQFLEPKKAQTATSFNALNNETKANDKFFNINIAG